MTHIEILIRLLVYVFCRYQTGYRMSPREKQDVLQGMYSLFVDFFSTYISNDKLGPTRLEISSRDNLCVPIEPESQDETEVPRIFQID